MMELSVYKIDGTVAKTVTLNEEIFGITPNDHAIYLDVKQYLANQRQGTAKTRIVVRFLTALRSLSARRVQVAHVTVHSRLVSM